MKGLFLISISLLSPATLFLTMRCVNIVRIVYSLHATEAVVEDGHWCYAIHEYGYWGHSIEADSWWACGQSVSMCHTFKSQMHYIKFSFWMFIHLSWYIILIGYGLHVSVSAVVQTIELCDKLIAPSPGTTTTTTRFPLSGQSFKKAPPVPALSPPPPPWPSSPT